MINCNHASFTPGEAKGDGSGIFYPTPDLAPIMSEPGGYVKTTVHGAPDPLNRPHFGNHFLIKILLFVLGCLVVVSLGRCLAVLRVLFFLLVGVGVVFTLHLFLFPLALEQEVCVCVCALKGHQRLNHTMRVRPSRRLRKTIGTVGCQEMLDGAAI